MPDNPKVGVTLKQLGGSVPEFWRYGSIPFGKLPIHCYVDDWRLESIWRADDLQKTRFSGQVAIAPDFSVFADDPLPLAQFQIWRNRVVSWHWKQAGCRVIPTVQFGKPDSWKFAVSGVTRGSLLAIRGPGLRVDMGFWREACEFWQEAVSPSIIIQFGRMTGAQVWKCPVLHRRLYVRD